MSLLSPSLVLQLTRRLNLSTMVRPTEYLGVAERLKDADDPLLLYRLGIPLRDAGRVTEARFTWLELVSL